MKRTTIVVSIIALAIAGPAVAKSKHHHGGAMHMASAVQVTERDKAGHATKVMMEGKEYAVCTAGMMDGCINPREAGLNWGNNPVADWPGHPTSDGKR